MFPQRGVSNLQRGPIDEDYRPAKRYPGISRQTLSFISASHNAARTPQARRASAEMASQNHYRETGYPLLIDEEGRAWRPDDFTQQAFHELRITELLPELMQREARQHQGKKQ